MPQAEVEVVVGIGMDGKLRHAEEEEGIVAVVVGKKIMRTKHVASIEDRVHFDSLKKRIRLVYNIVHTRAIIKRRK